MQINRRDLLAAGGISLLVGSWTTGQNTSATSSGPRTTPQTRLLEALQRNRLPITMTDGYPMGEGWDMLVREARTARFTLIGEEHGVAETAQFSAALFNALRPAGYTRLGIELSPPITCDIETAARRNGYQGIVDLLTGPGISTFYNLREEVQFIADVVKNAPKNGRILSGLDREIFSDRYLISRLEAKVPKQARDALRRMKDASAKAWARYERTKNPEDMFILAENPVLVSAVRAAWRNPDHESDRILRTLEESLSIETAERTGGRWPYAQRRAKWNRDCLVALLKEESLRKATPKIMIKMGYNHMIRGANYVNIFDIGSMVDELAALTSESAFHIIVLPSPGSRQAVFGKPVATEDFDDFGAGDGRLTRVFPRADAVGHEVIDLRSLRPLAQRGLESWNSDVVRTIHGYDAAVIWKGAKASSGLG